MPLCLFREAKIIKELAVYLGILKLQWMMEYIWGLIRVSVTLAERAYTTHTLVDLTDSVLSWPKVKYFTISQKLAFR